MNRLYSFNRFLLAGIMLFCNIPLITMAQKLPKVQLTGVRAPMDIKIDGKTTEWHDKFQANNPNNRIFYTISNDEDYVYLTVRTVDRFASEKALFGINFMIKSTEVTNEKLNEQFSINFPPIIDEEKNSEIRFIVTQAQRLEKNTSSSTPKKLDSLKNLANRFIDDAYKEISIHGIQAIKEPSISIYNTEGIKVAARFNDQILYVYELAIPLKYIHAYIGKVTTFSYKIKMDGTTRTVPGRFPAPVFDMSDMNPDYAYIQSSTDLSGTYTMVNK